MVHYGSQFSSATTSIVVTYCSLHLRGGWVDEKKLYFLLFYLFVCAFLWRRSCAMLILKNAN